MLVLDVNLDERAFSFYRFAVPFLPRRKREGPAICIEFDRFIDWR